MKALIRKRKRLRTNPFSNSLSSAEQKRLDQLLSSARNFHYLSFLLSAMSLAIASLEQFSGIKLPIGEVNLPPIQAAVGLYLIVIVLAILAEGLFSMAWPWMELDTRRPSYPWIALGNNVNYLRVTLWIVLPVLLCSIFTSFYLSGDYVGIGLLYGGVGAVILSRTFKSYGQLIATRSDHRGGKATYSIYLLYWYRIFRQSIFTLGFLIAVVAAIPKWRPVLFQLLILLGTIVIAIFIIRIIAGLPPIYRLIDKLGKRFGFPTTSEHYK